MAVLGARARRAIRLVTLTAALLLHQAVAAAALGEYQVKAVFLFNFAHFVEWPESAFPSADAPFVICVAGRDPFGSSLDEAVRGETIKGRVFAVERHRNLAEFGTCHILFIDRSAVTQGAATLETVGQSGTLTVSDSDTATGRDVIVRFLNENQKIRLRINLDSARSAGLTISSKLLRPAQVIGSVGGDR